MANYKFDAAFNVRYYAGTADSLKPYTHSKPIPVSEKGHARGYGIQVQYEKLISKNSLSEVTI